MQQTKGRTAKKENFVKQAGILAAAGIIVRIIGLLYRSPLTSIIGDEGNGYYTFAYNIYVIILLISSYSIPSAISKVMAQRLAFEEYKNAYRLFYAAVGYVIVVGGLASLFAFFAAPFLVVENAVLVLRFFAPTIFLSGLLGVLRGYFQAHRTMTPTSFSQILEQIANAAVSIGAAYLFIHFTLPIMGRPNAEDTTDRAVRGALGSSLGTGIGVLIALIFMFILFMRDHNERKYLMEIDRTKKMDIETYGCLLKTILTIVTPFILSTFIYNFSTSMNQTVYAKVMMKYHAFTQVEAATNYGIFAGKAVVIANIPIAFSSAMASALIPGISASFAKGEKKSTKEKVSLATKVTMLIAIPSAFGFLFLAKPIMQLLFPQKASLDTASALLRALAVTVVFYSLSTLTNAILQSIGKVTAPVVHASIALVVQAIVLVIGLFTLKHSLYALVLAQIAYSFVMCLLNGYAVRKHLRFRQRPQRVYILPTIASLIMGLLAFATYRLLNLAVASNVICLTAAIFVAVLVYFILVIKLHIVGERQLLAIPKGTSIVRFAKKLKLL